MGKFHSKTAEEADALLSQSLPSSRRAIKPLKESAKEAVPLPAATSKDVSATVSIKTEVSGKPSAKKPKEAAVKPAKQPVKKVPIEPKAKIEADVTDPDKISCPICTKLWHKSNLRFLKRLVMTLKGNMNLGTICSTVII